MTRRHQRDQPVGHSGADQRSVPEHNGGVVPPAIIRPGADDPIGLRQSTAVVRNGLAAWRTTIVGLGAAIFLLIWLGLVGLPYVVFAYVPLSMVSLMSLSQAVRTRRLVRGVLHQAAAHGEEVTIPPYAAPREIFMGAVILAELAVLIALMVHLWR